MRKERQQLIVGVGYYILAVLVVLFFYREESVSSEFVQMICAVLFLFILPALLVRKSFKEDIRTYNWPVGYVRKQLGWSVVFVWGVSLLFWGFMLQWGGADEAKKLIWKNGQVVKLILINLTIIPIGLLAQEFFFRGFLLKIFRDSFNKWFSVSVVAVLAGVFSMILVQTIFDWQVLMGIFVANVFLGLMVLKVRSIIFSFFVYWIVVVWVNFMALYQLGSRLGS
jgi:membrane protease YdiL (CAAX protease family)